mmetsp:Transcript_38706/g.109447  ORF Transcript_38706/g.109447 Transcript_38706/m.109447 type:complete len:251 (-) Transcript_38706:268-1020(-)
MVSPLDANEASGQRPQHSRSRLPEGDRPGAARGPGAVRHAGGDRAAERRDHGQGPRRRHQGHVACPPGHGPASQLHGHDRHARAAQLRGRHAAGERRRGRGDDQRHRELPQEHGHAPEGLAPERADELHVPGVGGEPPEAGGDPDRGPRPEHVRQVLRGRAGDALGAVAGHEHLPPPERQVPDGQARVHRENRRAHAGLRGAGGAVQVPGRAHLDGAAVLHARGAAPQPPCGRWSDQGHCGYDARRLRGG